jgi:hypothetical protein
MLLSTQCTQLLSARKPDNDSGVCEGSFIQGLDESVDSSAGFSFKPSTPVEHGNLVIVYKIGDLGHATRIADPQVEDGDARYLAPEILDQVHPSPSTHSAGSDSWQNLTHLPKADILSLGMSIYELAMLDRLPVNGPAWQKVRRNMIPFLFITCAQLRHDHPDPLPRYSHGFNDLLRVCTAAFWCLAHAFCREWCVAILSSARVQRRSCRTRTSSMSVIIVHTAALTPTATHRARA